MAQKVIQRQVIKKLVKKYGAKLKKNGIFISQIYLYGSYAKGTPTPDSDIDICVISPQFQDRIESTMMLLKLRTTDELRLSPIAFSEKDFTDDNPLAHEIKKTGTTLQNEKNKKIGTASKAIAQHYAPEKILLFGSHAWGNPTRDSDIDLLVIKNFKKGKTAFLKEQQKIQKIMNGEFAVDVLIYTPQEIELRLKTGDPFIQKILTKGECLYEK